MSHLDSWNYIYICFVCPVVNGRPREATGGPLKTTRAPRVFYPVFQLGPDKIASVAQFGSLAQTKTVYIPVRVYCPCHTSLVTISNALWTVTGFRFFWPKFLQRQISTNETRSLRTSRHYGDQTDLFRNRLFQTQLRRYTRWCGTRNTQRQKEKGIRLRDCY